jgi:hypothetical protein
MSLVPSEPPKIHDLSRLNWNFPSTHPAVPTGMDEGPRPTSNDEVARLTQQLNEFRRLETSIEQDKPGQSGRTIRDEIANCLLLGGSHSAFQLTLLEFVPKQGKCSGTGHQAHAQTGDVSVVIGVPIHRHHGQIVHITERTQSRSSQHLDERAVDFGHVEVFVVAELENASDFAGLVRLSFHRAPDGCVGNRLGL